MSALARATPSIDARRRVDRAGTLALRTDDGSSVRRRVQCACGTSAPYIDPPGPSALWALGWGSRWNVDAKPPHRVWSCPECHKPARLPRSLRRPDLDAIFVWQARVVGSSRRST